MFIVQWQEPQTLIEASSLNERKTKHVKTFSLVLKIKTYLEEMTEKEQDIGIGLDLFGFSSTSAQAAPAFPHIFHVFYWIY
jgi:hypothetical protein